MDVQLSSKRQNKRLNHLPKNNKIEPLKAWQLLVHAIFHMVCTFHVFLVVSTVVLQLQGCHYKSWPRLFLQLLSAESLPSKLSKPLTPSAYSEVPWWTLSQFYISYSFHFLKMDLTELNYFHFNFNLTGMFKALEILFCSQPLTNTFQ